MQSVTRNAMRSSFGQTRRFAGGNRALTMKHALPPLPYAYDVCLFYFLLCMLLKKYNNNRLLNRTSRERS